MRRSYLIVMGLVLIVIFTMATDIRAAAVGEDFYRGKVIRIVVGFSAGGGFDTYARTLSRSMGKYIPGHPTVIVQNMPGAGGISAANAVINAPPDGHTIVLVDHNLDAVRSVVTRVLVMARGRKIADGAVSDVLRNADVVRAYTGTRMGGP